MIFLFLTTTSFQVVSETLATKYSAEEVFLAARVFEHLCSRVSTPDPISFLLNFLVGSFTLK